MAIDGTIKNQEELSAVQNSEKTFLYVQPNSYPMPWGQHPNFQCHCPDGIIKHLNNMENVSYWNFTGEQPETGISFYKWEKKINVVPLAFDSIAYKHTKDERYAFDVCYIGGRANNGFDEKYKIMLNYFGKFRFSKRKVGIFIDKNLTHEQENLILCNSKVCLNVHDNWQKTLVTSDTNERTFKSLGCNGIMVSDTEGFIPRNFPDLKICDTPDQMLELSEYYLNMSDADLEKIRTKYKNLILEKHTYINRINDMLVFADI